TTRTATRTATASTTLTPSYTRTPTSSRTANRTVSASSTRTATPTVTISVTAGTVAAMPVIPVIDAAAKSRLRQIFLNGQMLGNRATVFAKAGDSITASWSFLVDIGFNGANMAANTGLATTITYFRSTALGAPSIYGSGWCDVSNSFNAYSVSADSGWSADYALAVLNPLPSGCTAPNNTAFLCELKRKKPSIVLIMYGTNDVERYNNPATFTTQLTTMVQQSVAAGVIPVLSTIPPRVGYSSRVLAYNNAIIAVAQAQQVPLWNYWLTFQSSDMVNGGLDGDGVHPNIYMGDQGANFDTTALRYGYNQRNLTAVQVLDVLRRVVLLDEAVAGE
ncbi:MAG: SGNH/GDSL hydrolase family protein, partial [Roseiflexaceae bacterium]